MSGVDFQIDDDCSRQLTEENRSKILAQIKLYIRKRLSRLQPLAYVHSSDVLFISPDTSEKYSRRSLIALAWPRLRLLSQHPISSRCVGDILGKSERHQ